MVSKEKQINEALLRLKQLKVLKEVVNDFEKEQRIYYSERQNKFFDGILYWLDNEPEYLELVRKFEEKNNAVVYHCQLTYFNFGKCLTVLFVSNNEDEWEIDNKDLINGEQLAYVINLDDPSCSEFGYVGIASKNGGITRTY